MVAPQPVHVRVDKDPTRTSIERQCAWKAACVVAAARPEMTLGMATVWAVRGAIFMASGQGDNIQVRPQAPFEPVPEFDPDTPDFLRE